MNTALQNRLISFIWSITDDCLRDVYVRGKYRDVIQPMVVLRRRRWRGQIRGNQSNQLDQWTILPRLARQHSTPLLLLLRHAKLTGWGH